MRFSDYLIYDALCENNLALRAVGGREDPLSDASVHALRLVVKRLRAYWLLLDGAIPKTERRAACARLKGIHKALACARDQVAVAETIEGLLAKAPSEGTREAVRLAAETLRGNDPNGVRLMVPTDLVARSFQEESRCWRDMDRRAIDDPALFKGYLMSYRISRQNGLRALGSGSVGDLHRWRGWVRTCKEQLELIRPVLGEEGVQVRFHLARLNDSLGKHHDLAVVRNLLESLRLPQTEHNRVAALIDLRMRYAWERAGKLYPECYRYAPENLVGMLRRDLNGLDFVALVAARERHAA